MSLFIKRHKFLSLSFLILIILIPILVFAYNSRLEGYRVEPFSTRPDVSYTESNGAVSFPMVAIQNDSPNDLFVPTKTWTEWSAFLSGRPSGVSIKDYCGGGACEIAIGESCSNCEDDCEPCAPVCGDGTCNGTETCSTCPTDCLTCLPFCGDGVCNDSETSDSCPGDCPGCCLLTFFELHQSEECSEWFCTSGNGDNDYCSKNCTYIDAETREQKSIRYYKYKNNNTILQGAIDQPCRTAPDMNYCSHLPDCAWMNPLSKCDQWCGDHTCSSSESCSSCPTDCGYCNTCGNGTCDSTENCLICSTDCGACLCYAVDDGNSADVTYCSGIRNQFACESKSGGRCYWAPGGYPLQ